MAEGGLSGLGKQITNRGYVLTPGRYVGAADVADDDEPFAEKMERLAVKLAGQFAESARLEQVIVGNLARLGWGPDELN